MKKIIILFILLLVYPTTIYAACVGTTTINGDQYTAYDASYDCVALAVSDAESNGYGNTVNIPACAQGSCVWTSSVTITKDMIIKGAGKDSTYIRNNITPSGSVYSGIFRFQPDATTLARIDSILGDTAVFEISNITFDSESVVAYRCAIQMINTTNTTARRIKIHDNRFATMSMSIMTDGSNTAGVIYNNIFLDARGPKFGGIGVTGYDYNPMKLGDGEGWYVEDNTYTITGSIACTPMMCSNANNAGGYVLRYNTASGTLKSGDIVAATETHGNQNSDIFSAQKTEMYGNSINVTQYAELHHIRGGPSVIFYNKHKNDDLRDIGLYEEYSDLASISPRAPTNLCPEVDGVQECGDSCVCGKVHGYFWANQRYSDANSWIGVTVQQDDTCYEYTNSTWCTATYPTKGDYPIHNNPREIVINREFFLDSRATAYDAPSSTTLQNAGTFNGTSGVGCGTLDNRPTTCTTGVGYWATNQKCDDLTGMVGANPSTPISGTLYKCTSTDTWTSYYTPYTYPHPLRGLGNRLSGGVVAGGTF